MYSTKHPKVVFALQCNYAELWEIGKPTAGAGECDISKSELEIGVVNHKLFFRWCICTHPDGIPISCDEIKLVDLLSVKINISTIY